MNKYNLKKRNPNIKFNSFLKYNNNNQLKSNIFEIYKSIQNYNFYIIIPNKSTNNIDIFSLNKNELEIYKILKGQYYEISILKYYKSDKNEEYLLSTNIIENITIWDISHDYIILKIIETNYKCNMYSNLLLFTPNEYYIVTTCSIDIYNINDSFTRLYSLKDGKLIKNIPGTNLNITCYILKWFNKIDNNYYIIECCQGKICIYNIYNYTLYIAFFNEKHESNFYKGFIYSKNDNDYLISGDDCGRIFIWNLITKTEIRKIYVYNENNLQNQIYHMNQWDKKYFYVYEFKRNSIIFIDFDQLKKVSCFKFNKYFNIEDIKVINLPFYGKSLLISNEGNNIEIWN